LATIDVRIIGFAIVILAEFYGAVSADERREFRKIFPTVEVARVFEFVWREEENVDERVNACLGAFKLLIAYSEEGLEAGEFDMVMRVIGIVLSHLNQMKRGSLAFARLLWFVLAPLNALIAQGALDPGFFLDTGLGRFVNRELVAGDDRSKVRACQIWESLIHRGGSARWVALDSLLDLVDCDRRPVAHAALKLMETMLRESPERQELVAELVSASVTEKGFATFLPKRAAERDFENLRDCGACTTLIVLGAGRRELEGLMDSEWKIVEVLVHCLAVDELRGDVLAALAVIFRFAEGIGGTTWTTIKRQWLDTDGPGKMLELEAEDGRKPTVSS
jgi:hypothetical protein